MSISTIIECGTGYILKDQARLQQVEGLPATGVEVGDDFDHNIVVRIHVRQEIHLVAHCPAAGVGPRRQKYDGLAGQEAGQSLVAVGLRQNLCGWVGGNLRCHLPCMHL